MHSTASDGRFSPARVMEMAQRSGLELVALTDHDTVAGVPEAMARAKSLGLDVISGTEVSTRQLGNEVHLLAYGFDPEHPGMVNFLQLQQQRRNDRALAFLERFRAEGLVSTDASLPDAPAGRSWARPHLASVLINHGAVSSMEEAFARYLSPGCELFVEKPMPDGHEVMSVVHAAGGKVFLAHPGNHVSHAIVLSLIEAGMDGIEVCHPSHDDILEEYYRGVARQFGLLMSGGSDFHGRPSRSEQGLGSRWFEPDDSLLDALWTH